MDEIWGLDGGRVCGRPGPARVPWDLGALRDAGFTAIVSLECGDPGIEAVAAAGLRHLRLCVEDFTAPTVDQLLEFNRLTDEELSRGGRVLVHCYAGFGRTGTVLASRLLWEGRSVAVAVAEIRRRRRGALEVPAQVAVLHHFHRALAQGLR